MTDAGGFGGNAASVTTIKAVSLWQPWASAVAEGLKLVETRSWQTKYRGPLAIASAADDPIRKHGATGDDANLLAMVERSIATRNGQRHSHVPRGVVVAVCTLVDVVPTALLVEAHAAGSGWLLVVEGEAPIYGIRQAERAWGDYRPGRFAWLLADVVPLDPPVPVKGRQGIWNWERAA